MPGPSSLVVLLLILPPLVALAAAQRSNSSSSSWQTLSGGAPLVIARGGFSGLFPDSSSVAYSLALLTSPEAILWCDVQLTKDATGICFPDLNLHNASDIGNVFTNKKRKYLVNGVGKEGLFTVDFTLNDLAKVFLMQGIYSRTNRFDGNAFQILTVEDVARENKPSGFWLNIQHDAFFTQHNLSMRLYVLSVSRRVVVNYISSPEVNFLRSINTRFNPKVTKLVFRFLNQEVTEPTTNQTYGALLKNLTFIKTFATGILVPKTYIWPVDAQVYLQPHTSVVSDAHKEGLEVYASDFVNDALVSYNYSYDPVAEYLSFIDNGDFSVDGVLSDFPITPSAAINCYSHMTKNESKQVKLLVTSYNGASGDFPGCTDMAYNKAIADGVDVIDCSIQMTKDGIPICLKSINLKDSTNVLQSPFSNLMKTLPDLKGASGVFTFDLTWSEIEKNLTPAISNPYAEYMLYRNPNYRSAGKFLTFLDFLALAKNASSLSGVLISIENAAYLAEQEGMSVTDAVLDALSKAGYDNQTAIKVMIQSSNSNVLMKFKETTSHYELLYHINETIRDALNSTIEDITKFADSVVVTKASIYPDNQFFLTGITHVVPKLHAFGLPVYAQLFSNEFVSQAWDFFSDASVEINSFVIRAEIDGVITDFPMTAARYRKNRCLNRGNNTPPYMQPVQPGGLMQVITTPYLPPAEAPFPVLTVSDVNEAPLPSVSKKTPSADDAATMATGGSTQRTATATGGESSSRRRKKKTLAETIAMSMMDAAR